jgi:hypothetical protein
LVQILLGTGDVPPNEKCRRYAHSQPSEILELAFRARTDFAAIESDLEVIQKQLARLPTRRELARTAFGIISATMILTTLSLLFFLC